ncbi:MAG: hypothetical protein WC552_02615 [Candidatus Omnitrophota bacterium]
MLLKFVGWIWVISGIFFLLQPARFRNRLRRKSVKQLKRFFILLAFFLGILLINAAWGVPGFWAKLVLVFGLIGLVKAVFLWKAKTADLIIEWFANQPVKVFRMYAVGQIVVGAIILSA